MKGLISLMHLDLTRRSSLVFIFIFVIVIMLDSTIVRFFSFTGTEPDDTGKIIIFVALAGVYAVSCTFLLNSIRRTALSPQSKFALRYFYISIVVIQSFTFAVILLIIVQVFTISSYSIILLRIQTYVCHISPLIILSFLIFLFFRWILVKPNYVVFFYLVSFSLVCINLVISQIFLDSYHIDTHSPMVKPLTVVSYVISLGVPTYAKTLSVIFEAVSLISFLLMWIATVMLLGQFRNSMGRFRFYLIMSIPLIYYIFPLHGYLSDALIPLLASSRAAYAILYILIFSATKQVGAAFFGLTFWSTSREVYDSVIRKSLLMSSIGMAIVFSAIELTPLKYNVFPPYGLLTESYLPIGAFLIFIGIYTSAVRISRDSALRKEFYKSASSQVELLRSIGVSQMEKELEERVKDMQKNSGGYEPPFESQELDEENTKRILRDVLNELYSQHSEKQGKKD
jgi:hypothetical protein